jgi:hypothetical protein
MLNFKKVEISENISNVDDNHTIYDSIANVSTLP